MLGLSAHISLAESELIEIMKAQCITRICLLGLIVFLGHGLYSVWGMASRPPLIGSPAPIFHLTSLSGAERSLQDYQGKVVLLNFWATWCKPCTTEMPAMQTAYNALQEKGFVVVAINELEDVQKVREHIQEHQHTFEVLLDPDNQVANMYGVVGLPVSVFIDQKGNVQKIVKGGLLTEESILETVHPLLQEVEISSLP
jgi:peroxiredoxin